VTGRQRKALLLLIAAGFVAVGCVIGVAIQQHRHSAQLDAAQAAVIRAHRVAALADIDALTALRRGDAQGAAESLNEQLNFEILGLLPSFRLPRDEPDLAKCQLTRIHKYRLDYPKRLSNDHWDDLERDVLSSLPPVSTDERVDSCFWVRL
jgi:hypothetical protein